MARKAKYTADNNGNGNGGANLGFEQPLWATADKLRGHVDPGEYKHVVLGLIFLKNIKGSSSRFFTANLQPNYAAISISPSEIEAVMRYILNQKQHHDSDACWSEYERVNAVDDETE